MLQAMLGNLTFEDYSLEHEAPKILLAAQRLTKCCIEYMLATEEKAKKGVFRGLLQTVTLSKCLEVQLWDNTRFVSKQIDNIGAKYCDVMAKAGLITFKSMMNEQQIEKVFEDVIGNINN